MENLNKFEAIIFDLGGVILNLDLPKTVVEFEKFIPHLEKERFLGKKEQHPVYNQYEIGKISTDDFFEEFKAYNKTNISFIDFKKCWNAMILDIPKSRIDLILKLKKSGKKIFLLSNINHLHELAVDEKYLPINSKQSFLSLFDKGYYSHHIGLRKPNSEVFEFVVREQKLNPEKTLFIDDSLHHVEGSKKIGIHGVHLEKSNHLENLEFLFK